MSRAQSKAMLTRPPSCNWPLANNSAIRSSMLLGLTGSGHSPISPMIAARSLPWPTPVADSEPYRRTCSRAVRSSKRRSANAPLNSAAARIGPTVCELDGPMPILNKSNTLIATTLSCTDATCRHDQDFPTPPPLHTDPPISKSVSAANERDVCDSAQFQAPLQQFTTAAFYLRLHA